MHKILPVFSITSMTSIMLSLALAAMVAQPVAKAQYGQGLLSGIYQNGAATAVEVLRHFYKENQHLPRTTEELDDFLCKTYAAIGGSPVNLINTPITSWNEYRTLGSVITKCDPTITNAPVDIYSLHPPENWMVPGGKIVVLSDGTSGYLIWYATISGVPMLDENNHVLIRAGNFASSPTQ